MADTHQQAQEKLAKLIEDAHSGAIIPVRLPGQLEEIAALLSAKTDESDTSTAAASNAEDVKALIQENAEFISTAVHELRTPMTSIRGYSDMLSTPAMGELSPQQQMFVNTIRTNTRRMERLLQDVSDLGKLRSGTLKLTEKMDMFKNIAGILQKETEPFAEDHGKTLTFDIPQGLPLLNTDGEFFAKAIQKLVENSIQYSQEDGAVTVSAHAEDNLLLVEVKDNGIGMTPEETAMLGTLYWRADNELVRSQKGSGLGLPIAYGILDLLGATVDVQSTPGEGTTFTVRLAGMT